MKTTDLCVLVLGSGGREHALVEALASSACVSKLYAAPGNAGTADTAEPVCLDITSPCAVGEWATEHSIDLAVIGPEAPLAAGVADALRSRGVQVFGPNGAAARLESSKKFAKQVMNRAGVPTAAWRSFSEKEPCLEYVQKVGAPIVIKADGLAAGKGVFVAMSLEEALSGVEACFGGAFGAAGAVVVVEEMLCGQECSLLSLTDGHTLMPLPMAQDHKRAYDGDAGPNTGGMGAYSPCAQVSDEDYLAMVEIEQKIIDELAAEGKPFSGCLYGGFILTDEGPKVLEFNVRFGDPETQVVLPRIGSDLAELFVRCDAGTLGEGELIVDECAAVTVVLASGGYPGHYETGKVISGLSEAAALEGVTVYHAGTAFDENGAVVTAGGRVLDVTARADTVAQARDLAYRAADLISFEGKFCRRDIAVRGIG